MLDVVWYGCPMSEILFILEIWTNGGLKVLEAKDKEFSL
jgi:hypothetical protein